MIDASARDAWRDLEAKLRPFIARRVHAEADVDDVLQDVFLRMQHGLSQLRDDERFGSWVYRVARSSIVDHHRRMTRHPTVGEDGVEIEAEPDDDAGVERELATYVSAFVAMLPPPYGEALRMTELEGLTQKQAAEAAGVSLSAMKSRVQRGREQLRDALEACCRIALDARGNLMSCEPRRDGKLPDSCCR